MELNPSARPYHRRSTRAHPHLAPPKPHPFMTPSSYHAGDGYPPAFPLSPDYSCATFPEYHHPAPLPPRPFFRERDATMPMPPPHRRRRPRALDSEKLYAQALYNFNRTYKARAAGGAKGKRGGPPPGGLLPAAPSCGPRGQQQQQRERARGRSKVYVPVGRRARSPSPAFTRRSAWPVPPPAWHGRFTTTVMIRNIPNKLTRGSMMELLDEHCAREKRRRGPGAPTTAYDFLYLPMDFRQRCSNKGYAFVNLTTAEAARGLHYALHGRGWSRSLGSRKMIRIDAARMQGKHRLVRYLSRSTFACHTDDYLPAVFSPPRDGAADPPPRHLGRRVPPRTAWVRRGEAGKLGGYEPGRDAAASVVVAVSKDASSCV